ncbi:MAG: hypothetical protein ACTHJ6_00115 [Oryzihumus sp.]
MTGLGAPLVEAWQQGLKDLQMGPDGLFQVELRCLRCSKVLNADGGHPAEVHAGCYNGLCYACTAAGPYVEKVYLLDGARAVNYPPHCPSWRRDREHFTGYLDCPECKGSGVAGWLPTAGGSSSYRHYCTACHSRFYDPPLRRRSCDWSRLLMERAQAAFERRLKQHLGLRPRCSRKAYQAALATLSKEDQKPIAAEIIARCQSLRALNQRRDARLLTWAWRQPSTDEVLQVTA